MIYAEVIGDPVAHSKSPLIHNFWLAKLGIAAEYRKTHVRPEELTAFFAERRRDPDWRGCNVTVPHKQAVIPHLDRLDPLAERIGAVNTVVREGGMLVGYNSDAPGFIEPIAGVLTEGHHLALIGAGGAARAALAALAKHRLGSVRILTRRTEQARSLLDELCIAGGAFSIESEALTGASLIVNASPLGMIGFPPLELDLDRISIDEPVIYDMVYAPLETRLLADARSRSALIMPTLVDGLRMLVAQASSAFTRFFGSSPPREFDAILRQRLMA